MYYCEGYGTSVIYSYEDGYTSHDTGPLAFPEAWLS